MAILGYNTVGGASLSEGAGRKAASKYTLAVSATMQELHAWVVPPSSASQRYVIHIYADSAGSPGARVAYTSPLGPYSGGGVTEISQTGFSVALPAGIYWLGVTFEISSGGHVRQDTSSSTLKAILSGAAFSPPSDPFGTPDYSPGAGALSVWAVVADPVYAYSSYSFSSAESITRTFNAYSGAGADTMVRYQGATPTDLAEKVWVYPPYDAGSSSSGGGISIFSGSS